MSSVFAATCSTDICVAPAAGSVDINKFSLCYNIANAGAQDILVPTKTQNEYQSFINATVPNITKTACPSAPTYVNVRAGSGSGSTSCSVPAPTGLQAGDLLISVLYDNTTNLSSLVPPSGFNTLYAPYTVITSYRSASFYKIADASDAASANFTFTRTGNFTECGVSMIAFRGVNQTTPINDKTLNIQTSGTVTWLSANVTTMNSLIFAIGEGGSAPGLPTGFTNHGSLSGLGERMASKVATSLGATGNFTSTNVGQYSATLVILNPQ